MKEINASVQRYSASPAGLNYVEHNYTPTGALRIPMLTLSTFRDPVAPASIAARTVQRSPPPAIPIGWCSARSQALGYGHCTFTPQELATGFFDLVLWAEHGVKPPN
jgi:hypothetical protein